LPPIPYLDVNGPKLFCGGDSVELSVGDDPAMTYQWMNEDITIPNAISSGYYTSSSGNYRLVLTNSVNCSSETLPVAITVYPSPTKPTISLSGPESFCQGSSVELSVPDDPNSMYKWFKFGGAVGNKNLYIANTSGDFTLEITNSDGCTIIATNSVLVTVNPTPLRPAISVNGGNLFCAGDSTQLRVNEEAGLTYQWINGTTNIADANSPDYYAKATGDYKVEVTNSYGCPNQSTGESINVKPPPIQPTISFIGKSEICEGETMVLNALSNPLDVHEWLYNNGSVGSNSTSLVADKTGTYSLRVTNAELCMIMAENTVDITINPNPATPAVVQGESSFCEGDSTQLKGADNPSLSFQWINGTDEIVDANSNVYYAKTTGEYKLRVKNSFECSVESQANTVTVKESPLPPTISYSGDVEFCEGEQIELYVPEVVENTYVWLKNNINVLIGSNSFIADETGDYKLRVSNSIGCEVFSTNEVPVIVKTYPLTPVISAGGAQTFCEGFSVELSVTADLLLTYQWLDGETIISGANTNSYLASTSGNYKLNISSGNGCPVETQAKEVVVHPYPLKPLIVTENYTEGECIKLDSIEIYLDNTEAGIDYQWLIGGEHIVGETSGWIEGRIDEGNYKVEATYNECLTVSDPISIQFAEMPETPQINAEGPVIWYLVCSDTNAVDYRWFYEGELIEGANDILFLASQQLGKYEVSISDGGCYAISDPLWIPLGTGIELDPWENLKIYPNPTPGLFTLEMDNHIMGELIIDIFNENGSKVINIKFLKETSHFVTQIDLSAQPAAVYLIGLMLDEYRVSRRLIVE
jgi:hypothetical protein